MPVSEEHILQLLDAEEPDYRAAIAEVGADGFDALTSLVQNADASVAARAASLAAAALGASRAGAAAVTVVTKCLADEDAGVRLMAFRGLSPPLDPAVSAAVQTLAAGDAQPSVRGKATALAARNPDPALGNELIAGALNYAQARLADLRDDILGSVASFAAAVGVPEFPDPGGLVAAHLTAAGTSLDLVAPRMAVNDFSGAAIQIGSALHAIADAAASVVGGMSFINLLSTKIAWAAVLPRGLAKQIGLPTAPALSVDGAALTYRITAPARLLMAAPLTLGFDRADLTARLAMDGSIPPLSIALTLTGIEVGVGGGPIASLLGGAGGSVQADVVLGVDTAKGMTLGGGAGTRIVLPARPKVGPLDLREIALELPEGRANTIDVGSTITADLGGVIAATVDGAGLHLHIDPAAAINGDNPLSVSLKSPTGIGLVLDTGLVRGGGFLGERFGGYGGALNCDSVRSR